MNLQNISGTYQRTEPVLSALRSDYSQRTLINDWITICMKVIDKLVIPQIFLPKALRRNA